MGWSKESLNGGVSEILDRLDAVDDARVSVQAERRASDRVRYRYRVKARLVIHASGATGSVTVMARNLSHGGIGFVHGHRLFVNTECSVMLEPSGGGLVPVTGWVVRCREVEPEVFEMGVAFSEAINVAQFVKDAVG